MRNETKTVTGTFDTRADAERASVLLNEAGFPRREVSILVSQLTKASIVGGGTASGAGIGGLIGGALGAVAGALAYLGGVSVPGVGLLAGGPIVAALATAGAAGGAGMFIGALVGLGLSASGAKELHRRLTSGGIVVAVHAEEPQVDGAMSILRAEGGHQVHQHA